MLYLSVTYQHLRQVAGRLRRGFANPTTRPDEDDDFWLSPPASRRFDPRNSFWDLYDAPTPARRADQHSGCDAPQCWP